VYSHVFIIFIGGSNNNTEDYTYCLFLFLSQRPSPSSSAVRSSRGRQLLGAWPDRCVGGGGHDARARAFLQSPMSGNWVTIRGHYRRAREKRDSQLGPQVARPYNSRGGTVIVTLRMDRIYNVCFTYRI